MNRKIYFRADGNTLIGLGHLTRCIALAQMLQPAFEVVFVCKEITQNIALILKKLSIGLIFINEEDQFFRLLDSKDFVVLDHYDLDTKYQIRVKNIGCKLICIDDLHDKEFYADLIINHAPNVDASAYKVKYYTQFAIGLDYVLLRPIFLNGSPLQKATKIKNSVFVCFGGSDNKNLTQRLVEILEKDSRFKSIFLVVGSAYGQLPELKKAIEDDDRFKLYVAIDAEEIAELISSSAIAIVPASGILQEALALNTNVIAGMYVENQRDIFENYKKLGAFVSAEDFSIESTLQAIDTILSTENKSKSYLIDGKSGIRLLKCFKQLLLEEEIQIEVAKDTDLHKTFSWANNEMLRHFFFNTNAIPFEEHQKWYLKKIEHKNCHYYIGWLNGEAFGSIRFDVSGDIATVSYLIDPSFQGQGLGTILLKKGLDILVEQAKNKVRIVKGEVLFNNLSSARVFRKLGYTTTIDKEAGLHKFEKIIK